MFAGAKGDQEALLEYLMRNPDGAKRCAGKRKKRWRVDCRPQAGVTASCPVAQLPFDSVFAGGTDVVSGLVKRCLANTLFWWLTGLVAPLPRHLQLLPCKHCHWVTCGVGFGPFSVSCVVVLGLILCCCRALGVLRKPSVGPQLVYKFAPELLAAATQETVDFLVASGKCSALFYFLLHCCFAFVFIINTVHQVVGANLHYVRFLLLRAAAG